MPYDAVRAAVDELEAAGGDRDAAFRAAGDLLFAAVNVARKLRVDPELALRSATGRFRDAVERAEQLAGDRGERWTELDLDRQITFYAQARLENERASGGPPPTAGTTPRSLERPARRRHP